MAAKWETGARVVFQIVLLILAGAFALWEFKQRAAPQPIRIEAAATALRAGKPDQARAEFETALKSNPNDPAAYEKILATCSEAKSWDLMLEYGNRALSACKNLPKEDQAVFYTLLADAYEGKHNSGEAIAMARRALDLQPQDSMIQNEYGYLLADNAVKKGPDVTEALRVLKEALVGLQKGSGFSLGGLNSPVQLAETEDSYGWALYKNEQYPDAVTTLTQALNDYPEGSTPDLDEARKVSFYHLGMAYLHNGQADQARNAFQKCLFFDANDTEAKAGLKELDEVNKKK